MVVEQIFTSERDKRGDEITPEQRGWKYVCTNERTTWQLVLSWHRNHHHCAVTENKNLIIQIFELSLWFSYIQKKQHFSSWKNVYLLYAAVPPREAALEDGVISPSQIASRFVMVSRLWLAVSHLQGEHFWRTCAIVAMPAWHHACRVPGVSNFKIWRQLGSFWLGII